MLLCLLHTLIGLPYLSCSSSYSWTTSKGGDTTADKLSVEKISSNPKGLEDLADNCSYPTPRWAEAGKNHIEKIESPKLTILQWIRHAVVKLYTRVPYNKIKTKFGFVCLECISRGNRIQWEKRPTSKGGDGTSNASWTSILEQAVPRRCRKCNTKHGRYKRASRAMKKIFRSLVGNQVCWFVTLTKPNRIFQAGDTIDLEADKADWIAEFRRFRQRKVWKDTFAGGYWFYEYTVHAPGDKIYDKKNRFIRQCKDFELNGHLHILATSSPRIPMKKLATNWDGRADFRRKDERTGRPLTEGVVLRYLRGYLTKTDMPGAVNMRPFGNIHRINET